MDGEGIAGLGELEAAGRGEGEAAALSGKHFHIVILFEMRPSPPLVPSHTSAPCTINRKGWHHLYLCCIC